MKNILFYLGHPAQYHFAKNTILQLKKDGFGVRVLIKTKDILEELLQQDGVEYVNIQPHIRKNSRWSILMASFRRTWRVVKEAKLVSAEMLVGTDSSIAQAARLLRIPSLTTLEDDIDVIGNLAKLTYPFTSYIVVPDVCKVGKWHSKKIGYCGYMKLAYLHPHYFSPDVLVLKKYGLEDKKYGIIRLAKLTAHHDTGTNGLNMKIVGDLINICREVGYEVYITSERTLPPKLEKYRMQIEYTDIHHVLAFASLLVSDSQSMSVEASMLGVPSLRYSDFSGRISVLEELEHKYALTIGIKTSEPDSLSGKLKELLSMPNLKEEWQRRREKMLADKIDVTAFLTWFIENYPESARIMRENPDYQWRFR